MSAGILQGHGRVLLRHARRLQELLEVLSGEPRVLSLPDGEAFASSPRQHHQSRLLFQARPVRCWSPFNPLTALIHTHTTTTATILRLLFSGQPAFASTSSYELVDFVGAKFYCLLDLAHSD